MTIYGLLLLAMLTATNAVRATGSGAPHAESTQKCRPADPELIPLPQGIPIDEGLWRRDEEVARLLEEYARLHEEYAEMEQQGGMAIVVLHGNVSADGSIRDYEVRCTTLGPVAIKKAIRGLKRLRFPPTPSEGDVQFHFQLSDSPPPSENP
ncbi:MAG: hypothetical protein KDI78_06190 [Xanthomonadales bacterium]|nr:hypothetical protein [Xanthomonadales bacterium]